MASDRRSFRAAVVQVNAGNDMDHNIWRALDAVRRARAAGAEIVFLPENVAMMELGRENVLAQARTEAEHPALAAFRGVARETGAWVHGGTLAILTEDGRAANRTYLIAPDGSVAAHYDKIHMFDVDLSATESYQESDTFQPGERAVVADLPWTRLGLTVCYDVRFPALHRALAQAGAEVIAVPAAFTVPTGQAHWHVLLRARAIETGCYVLAPAQCGTHPRDRRTYGHALIIDPWGQVLADAGEADFEILHATIDPEQVDEARRRVPALSHDRVFAAP
ncbi:carbon-nitrogen hydrolase family protein [Roseospira marina]|uniref:Carbon-nitrogen hydrolase family protein n=1 Tax=Roseospira marina TaxID=140057 RepID=A0A5M6IAX7_9PROT|nr:carbon-nitrogen hydrolase family protein [Roseospira marina]KAA5604889.1 carbon-nitrogen hydrolase family protein [Roseospira marina]MBB4315228.1 putative amidohydrolase [Roseospira marina]MBB5088228.1 putative amidohydrolase [Roseospira marina]